MCRWPFPFSPIEDPDYRPAIEEELQRELKPGHLLLGLPVGAIGCNGDDVLFELLDDSGRVAEVHLTWAGEKEKPPWPGTVLFDNFAAWADSIKEQYS